MPDKPFEGIRALVVEDELLVAMLLEDMLGDLGINVVASAARLDEAMAVIETQQLDLAILDMNLNGERTTALADALAARGVPFLFASGYAAGDLGPDHAARPLLTKPFLESDLALAVAAVLTR